MTTEPHLARLALRALPVFALGLLVAGCASSDESSIPTTQQGRNGEIETGDPELDSLAARCTEGDFAACDNLFALSPAGSELEELAKTCGDRIPATSSSCAAELCPPEVVTAAVDSGETGDAELTGLVIAGFETEAFQMLICEIGGALYYYGVAKAPPNNSIVLPAEQEPDGTYLAANRANGGVFEYRVGPDELTILDNGEQSSGNRSCHPHPASGDKVCRSWLPRRGEMWTSR